MDYKKIAKEINELAEFYDYMPGRSKELKEYATAITDLLSRAEAAEATQETLQEYKARAEKAEKERDAAVNDLKEEVMGKIWACEYCKKNDPEDFQCKRDDLCGCSEWEWRGQKEE